MACDESHHKRGLDKQFWKGYVNQILSAGEILYNDNTHVEKYLLDVLSQGSLQYLSGVGRFQPPHANVLSISMLSSIL